MPDSKIASDRARAEMAAKVAQSGEGINPEYVSLVEDTDPDDYVEGTGVAYGSKPLSTGGIQRLGWDEETEAWVNIGSPIAEIDNTRAKTKPSGTKLQSSDKIPVGRDTEDDDVTVDFDVAKIQFSSYIFPSLSAFMESDHSILSTGDKIRILNFNGAGGYAQGYWDADRAKEDHDGGRIINPDHLADIGSAGWITSTGSGTDDSGNGCLVFIPQSDYSIGVSGYGGKSNDDEFDSANAINAMFTSANRRGIVDGKYSVTPGSIVLAKFRDSILRGQGQGNSGTISPINTNSGALITIGDGETDSGYSKVDNLSLRLNGDDDQGGFLLVGSATNGNNILDFENVSVYNIGNGGYGIKNTEGDILCQEIYHRRFSTYGPSDFVAGSYGAFYYATGNIEFSQSNIEAVQFAYKLIGREFSTLVIMGGHVERCQWFLDVDGAAVMVAGTEVNQGGIWLGDKVSDSDIKILANKEANTNRRGVIDNGFGNLIHSPSCLSADTDDGLGIDKVGAGISKSGLEWLFASNVDTDPLFKTGFNDWATNGNGTLKLVNLAAPRTNGRSLYYLADNDGDYIYKTFSVDSSKEYVLGLGILFNRLNRANIKVMVYDNTGSTLIHDSGVLTGLEGSSQGQMFKFHKVLLPAEASGGYQVRVVVSDADEEELEAIVQVVVLSPSDIVLGDVSGEDSSSETNGITTFVKDLSGGDMTFNPSTNKISRMIVRFKGTAENGTCYFSANGNANQVDAFGYFPIFKDEEREYTVILPHYNDNLRFFSYGNGTVTISEISVHEIPYDEDISSLGGKINGDLEITGDLTVDEALVVGGKAQLNGGYDRKFNTKYLGNIGTAVASFNSLRIHVPESTNYVSVPITVFDDDGDTYVGTIVVRKTANTIQFSSVIELQNSSSNFTVTLTDDAGNDYVDVAFDHSDGSALATLFYDINNNTGAYIEVL